MATPYPATLPCPALKSNSMQGGQSFIRSDFDYGTRQRASYCANYFVGFTFIAKTPEQMKAFKDFFYYTLKNGSKSFEADWEIEGISGVKEFIFSTPYTVSHLGLGKYSISASFEMLTKIKDL